MADTTPVQQGFPQARYPWTDKGGYPTRDFLYLIQALWDRTGGASGTNGLVGPPGPQGLTGVPVYLEAPEADEPFVPPGPFGPQGPQGVTGAQGPMGPAVFLDPPDADEPMVIPPRFSLGGFVDEKGSGGTPGFASGVDFTGGSTTFLTLSNSYLSAANLFITFDGTWQGADQFSLSGKTLTFTSAIPVGVSKVYVKGFLST